MRRGALIVTAASAVVAGAVWAAASAAPASSDASQPPTITAVGVTAVTASTITLQASIDPNGLDTHYAGQYGPTTSYGQILPTVDIGAGTSPVPVTVTLRGLASGTTYHVQLSAANGAGPTTAPDLVARTAAASGGSAGTGGAGGRFVRVAIDNPTSPDGALAGVACAAVSFCVAVGSVAAPSPGRALIERWTGGAWTPLAAPSTGGAALAAVVCRSRDACIAVGTVGGRALLALRWTGRTWVTTSTPEPGGAGVSGLNALSCPGADDCWAAGYVHGGTPAVTALVEHWDGHRWTESRLAGGGTYLTAISCAGTSDCWAVGSRGFSTLTSFAEHWDGHRWGDAVVPRLAGGLAAVSCPAAAMCLAGGASGLIRLAAGTWHRAGLPGRSAPEALICTSTSDCWAAGQTFTGPRAWRPFASHWDGSSWRTDTTVAVGPHSSFLALACPDATRCVAVGTTGRGPALAEASR